MGMMPGHRQEPEPARTRRGVATVLAVALVALTFAAFWPTLDNDLTNWDDDVNIVANPHIRAISVENVRWMFFSHLQGHYQPLTWLSYAVDVRLWGGSAFGFHLTNLILHAATALAFYVLAHQLIMRGLPDDPAARGPAGWFAAAIAAGAFAVHPLRVESVAWATERRDVLSGLFFVLTIILYVHSRDPAARRAALWFVAALGVYVFALLSKVMVVSLPVVLLVLDFYPLRRLTSLVRVDGGAVRVGLEKLPFFLLGFAASAMAVIAQSGASTMLPLDVYGPVGRLTQVVFGLGFYVFRTLVPVNLRTLYELLGPIDWREPRFLIPMGFVAVTTAALIIGRRRAPALLAAWVTYAVILVPVSGLFQNGPQIVADRYSYLSCMGFAVLVGGGWVMIGQRGRRRIAVGACLALMALAGLANDLSRSWKNSLTLWTRVAELDSGTCLGRLNLANSLAELGRHAEAIPLYQAVIQIRPNQARTHYACANSLLAMGRLDEAIAAYRAAVALRPNDADALNNLGNALWQHGDVEEAERMFESALSARPNYANAHYNLARLLTATGRRNEGLAHLRGALTSDPTFIDARTQLAFSLADAGRYADAIAVLDAGLSLTPRDARLAGALALFLATCPDGSLRDGSRAIELAAIASSADGGRDPVLLGTLAAAHAEIGKFDEAVRFAGQAARLATESGDVALGEEFRGQESRYARGLKYEAVANPD